MDVNFTNSFGTQMPLANIVESGDGYIKFSDGTAIAYGRIRTDEERLFSSGSTETHWAVSHRAYKEVQYPSNINRIFNGIYFSQFSILSYPNAKYSFPYGKYSPPCSVKFEDAFVNNDGVGISSYYSRGDTIVIDFMGDFYALRAAFIISYFIIGRWK